MKRSMKVAMLGTFATEGFTVLLGILTGSLVARLLLPEGRGALAAVLFWPQLLAGIGFLSLGEAVTYRIGMLPERESLIRASSFWPALAMSVVILAGGYLLMPFLLGEGRAHLWTLARFYLLYIPFNFVALALLATDQGRLEFERFNTLRLLVPLLYLAGIFLLWMTDKVSVGWFVAANFAATFLVALLALRLNGSLFLHKPSLEEAKSLFTYALRFHPATIVLLLAGQVDVFVVLALWDDATVGHYVIALTIASSGLSIISGAYHKVLFPHVTQIQDRARQIGLLARGVRHATLLLVALSLPLALFMPWIVPLLFGQAFNDAVVPALVLVAAYILVALKSIIIQSLRGFGEGGRGLIAAAISVLIVPLAAWPLGKHMGLVGVGIAVAMANFGSLGYLAYDLARRFQVNLKELWGLNPRTMSEVWSATSQLNPFIAKTTL